MVRIFTIYHDHQHGAILQVSALANAILTIFGLLLLTPPSIWRRSHQHHHGHNGRLQIAGIGSFPLMTTVAFANASGKERFAYAASRHPLTILAGYLTIFLYGMCLGPLLQRPRQHADAAVALLLHGALIVALGVLAPDMLVWTMILPLAVSMALGSYLFYAQHNFPGARLQEAGTWDHADAALAGSSYIPMNPLMCWFTGSIGYHHVHHLNARIPFYRLAEAMAGLEELQSPTVTILSPLGLYRCLRLKLWDPQRQCLVNFVGRI
jgi:acyl-lipid omega-6 desaturase (Delta-12 desaturase)